MFYSTLHYLNQNCLSIHAGDKPTLPLLICFKYNDENGVQHKIFIIDRVASYWRRLGPLLNISEDHLNNIEHNQYHKIENCCRVMLSDWLQGTAGDGSATWERLLEAIEDARCGELAKQVKTALPLLGMSIIIIIMIASYWSYHCSLTCRDRAATR